MTIPADRIFLIAERHGALMAVTAAAVRYLDTSPAYPQRYSNTTPSQPQRYYDTATAHPQRYPDTTTLLARADALVATQCAVHAIAGALWEAACETRLGPTRTRRLALARQAGSSAFIGAAAKGAERYLALRAVLNEFDAAPKTEPRDGMQTG